eukprot:3254103-Amphidinium_carterae.1
MESFLFGLYVITSATAPSRTAFNRRAVVLKSLSCVATSRNAPVSLSLFVLQFGRGRWGLQEPWEK